MGDQALPSPLIQSCYFDLRRITRYERTVLDDLCGVDPRIPWTVDVIDVLYKHRAELSPEQVALAKDAAAACEMARKNRHVQAFFIGFRLLTALEALEQGLRWTHQEDHHANR